MSSQGQSSSRLGFIISYVMFLGIVLFFAPGFDPDFINISELSVSNQPFDIFNPFTIFTEFFNRFGSIISLSTTNPIFGILVGGYTAGFVWIALSWIAEILKAVIPG